MTNDAGNAIDIGPSRSLAGGLGASVKQAKALQVARC